MGWWQTGQNDDIIGDSPADTLAETFQMIVSNYQQQHKPKPTLEEVLDAIASILREQAVNLVEDGENLSFKRLLVELESNSVQISGGEKDSPDEQLIQALSNAFLTIAEQYEDAVNRKPRVTELLACVRFILGYQPEEYLLIDEGNAVKKISLN
ncbi:hypothetical protein PCC7424_4153 [Gloeothece citriformis PCC 7424]|uniref:Uncharacterized protein n=1 Tax=Gloeothece citriformis (strain PCC 7424) TaxID=65393 RepID=B7KLF2_GLOC7|nr:hypothetical protein [Gloeothece citriformis]ACK72524.1 hypothetical protein PCC7424_4153 [Gloeothece citriformis PCC 7424]